MPRVRDKPGCTEYLTAEVTVLVSFPADMVICDICDFCRTENSGSRFRCLLNSKILPYHNKTIGEYCPLELKNKMNEEENEND